MDFNVSLFETSDAEANIPDFLMSDTDSSDSDDSFFDRTAKSFYQYYAQASDDSS